MLNALVLLAFYLPFQVALNPAAGIDLASVRVLVLLLFGGWIAKSLKEKKLFIKADLKTGLIASFLFFNAFSLTVARNQEWSWRKLLFLFSIFPIYFVATALARKKESIIKIVKALVWSGGLLAGIGIVQFSLQFLFGLNKVYFFWANYAIGPFLGKDFSMAVLRNPSWLVNIAGKTYLRATATFPDPHMLSFFLGMLAPWALMLAITDKNKKRNLLALGILLAGNLLTFSRGGYLGLFAGALVVIVFFWARIKKAHKTIALAIVSVAVLIFAIPNPVSSRFLSSFNLKEGSNKGRIETWEKAIAVTAKHPWLGVGIGNYSLQIKPTADYREPIYAHSAYLDIAAETGILNMLIWLAILGLSAKAFLALAKKDILFFAGATSVIIFAAHSLVETALYSPTVLTLLLLIISFSNVELANERNI